MNQMKATKQRVKRMGKTERQTTAQLVNSQNYLTQLLAMDVNKYLLITMQRYSVVITVKHGAAPNMHKFQMQDTTSYQVKMLKTHNGFARPAYNQPRWQQWRTRILKTK